jgi:diguanylate cyclase (GGDEF)-like protein
MKDLSQETTQSLLQCCPMALLLVGDNGKIYGFNRAFSALLGEAAAMLNDASQADVLLAPLLGTGTVIHWIMPDGDERWLAVESIAIGEAPCISARFYEDVTEKLRLKRERDALQTELKQQALHDERLPSLLSRYGLQVSLEPLVSASRRYNSPLSLVSISIDSDMDRDTALKKISYLLKDQTRWADLVGCNSVRDFILILQETTRDSALQLVDKLLARITEIDESTEGGIRACFGVTQCQRNDDAESMLERAESALSEARQNDSGIAIAV